MGSCHLPPQALFNVASLALSLRSTILALVRLRQLTDRFELASRIHASGIGGTPRPSLLPQVDTIAGPSLSAGAVGQPLRSMSPLSPCTEDAASQGPAAEPELPRVPRNSCVVVPPGGSLLPRGSHAGGTASDESSSEHSRPTQRGSAVASSTSPTASGNPIAQPIPTNSGGVASGASQGAQPMSQRGTSMMPPGCAATPSFQAVSNSSPSSPRLPSSPKLASTLAVGARDHTTEGGGVAEALTAAMLANLHVEYPFLKAEKVITGASDDIVENTMREARAWLQQPVHRRLFSLLSFFVCLDIAGNVCLLAYSWTSIMSVWQVRCTRACAAARSPCLPRPPHPGTAATLRLRWHLLAQHEVFVFDHQANAKMCSAVGSFCCWIGILRYFGHSRRLTLVTTTLKVAISPIVWTLISVSPVFFAFALTGIDAHLGTLALRVHAARRVGTACTLPSGPGGPGSSVCACTTTWAHDPRATRRHPALWGLCPRLLDHLHHMLIALGSHGWGRGQQYVPTGLSAADPSRASWRDGRKPKLNPCPFRWMSYLMLALASCAVCPQVSIQYPLFGRLYVYAFIGIFYLAIANIFIVLIESAHVISLQLLYKERGEGRSKTIWSSMGVDFARYARRVVNISRGGDKAKQAADEQKRRLDALEASLKQQTELLQQLLARTSVVQPGGQPVGDGAPGPSAMPFGMQSRTSELGR